MPQFPNSFPVSLRYHTWLCRNSHTKLGSWANMAFGARENAAMSGVHMAIVQRGGGNPIKAIGF